MCLHTRGSGSTVRRTPTHGVWSRGEAKPQRSSSFLQPPSLFASARAAIIPPDLWELERWVLQRDQRLGGPEGEVWRVLLRVLGVFLIFFLTPTDLASPTDLAGFNRGHLWSAVSSSGLPGVGPVEVLEMRNGLEHLPAQERLRELGLPSIERSPS